MAPFSWNVPKTPNVNRSNCRNCRSLRYAKSRAPEKSLQLPSEILQSVPQLSWKGREMKQKNSEISLPTGCPPYDVHPCRHWHRLCACSFSFSIEWKWRSIGTTYCSLLLHCHAEGERMTARWPDGGRHFWVNRQHRNGHKVHRL